jgi:uncharacterized membrane protein (DUF2068 family)
MGTSNVEVCMALQAGYTSPVVRLAELANLFVSEGACTDSLHHVKAISVAKLHLRMPKRAVYVYPVVIRGTLQWLTRNNRPTLFLLSYAIFLFGDVDELFLHALFLSVSIALLLVGDFRLLIQVLIRDFMRTKNALVCLDNVRSLNQLTEQKQLT